MSTFDPTLDLVLERVVPLTTNEIWRGWTEPELIVQWFTPAPWKTVRSEIDLRPGGKCLSVMLSPEGHEIENVGCILEVRENERFVFTSCLLPGFRPSAQPFFTGVIEMTPTDDGSLYKATALHKDAEDRSRHEEMGFHTGWGLALDQLVSLMLSLRK